MQGLFDENKKEEVKSTPLWQYALGVLGALGAIGAAAYYFWPL